MPIPFAHWMPCGGAWRSPKTAVTASKNETNLAANLARLEAENGDPLAALDHVALAIRNYDDSGSTPMVRTALAVLAVVLDRLGHREAAATIGGFAISPLATLSFPEINTAVAHLREILGDQTHESLAPK